MYIYVRGAKMYKTPPHLPNHSLWSVVTLSSSLIYMLRVLGLCQQFPDVIGSD